MSRFHAIALEIFHKVKEIRESHPNVESGSVIHPMLRIGNIQLCQGDIEKALECFSEVSTLTANPKFMMNDKCSD